ncbi:hypothetical protein PUN28_012109 [Cardiocondyla obscurior]|uniref:RNA 2-O ribose methyltransferase substrate binding domain-containing protein n=1 Tax=Cardiocondyla obscurior TaxID=286306 RepID=A0AAW2FEJ9_9HYME
MLLSIVQLSLRSVRGTKLLKPAGLRSTIKCEYGTKWTSRKPVAIVNEDELFDSDDEMSRDDKQSVFKTLRRRSRAKTREKNEVVEKTDEIRVSSTGIKYVALDANNKFISSLMIDIKTKKNREKSGQILLEGFRLIQDAIQAGLTPKIIFFSRISDIQLLSLSEEVELYKIPYRTIQLWSNLTTSPGIMGIFKIPDMAARNVPENAIPLTIICDNIREPGNLGTIIRAAAAVGCEKLILMKGNLHY